MPERKTIRKARKDLREGKSPSTAAGEFVHEEMEHIGEGKHGARSAKQAIAIGLAKRDCVPAPFPGFHASKGAETSNWQRLVRGMQGNGWRGSLA
jgi:hypothetical protein